MNRSEYMQHLERRLRKLPREDYEKAVVYFEEYFEEAGAENEAQAIEDLGTPELAADQIIRDLAVENAGRPVKNARRGFSAVWIGLLAVFAAPIALPVALVLGALALMVVIAVLCLIVCVFVLTVTVAVSAIPCIVFGIGMLFVSFADGIATVGMGLTGLGIGIWLVFGSLALGKGGIRAITYCFGKIAKGGRKHVE